jgi:hypothetical protein
VKQLQLISTRPFRTSAERIAYIRGKLDRIREERAARKLLRRRRVMSATIHQPGLFQ